jgi:hypothetical protein
LSIALLMGLSVAVIIKHFEADNDSPPAPTAAQTANWTSV